MESLNDQTPSIEDQYVSAEVLKEMTLSQEELFEIATKNICDSIMSSMVSVATKNGANFYGAQLLASMKDDMNQRIVETFENLGYETQMSELQTSPQTGQKYKVLTISWKNA